jgi:hypothetical protein
LFELGIGVEIRGAVKKRLYLGLVNDETKMMKATLDSTHLKKTCLEIKNDGPRIVLDSDQLHTSLFEAKFVG